MPAAMIGVGMLLVVVTFLLAFTAYGELAGLIGVVCVGVGAVMLARRQTPRARH